MYVYNDENLIFERVQTETPMQTHTPVPKNYCTKLQTYIFFSTKEGFKRRVELFGNKIGSHFFRSKAHLVLFFGPHCNIVLHTCCP